MPYNVSTPPPPPGGLLRTRNSGKFYTVCVIILHGVFVCTSWGHGKYTYIYRWQNKSGLVSVERMALFSPTSTFLAQFSRHTVGVPIVHHKPLPMRQAKKKKKAATPESSHEKRSSFKLLIIQPQNRRGGDRGGTCPPVPPPPGFAPMRYILV